MHAKGACIMNQPRSKGVYERIPNSGIWWIRYADDTGRIRREKAGSKSVAIKLYTTRKAEVMQGKKLPDSTRKRSILFDEIAEDALVYSRSRKKTFGDDEIRMARFLTLFKGRKVDSIRPNDLERALDQLTKTPATFNRYRAVLSLTFRIAQENGKCTSNPARIVKQKRENNAVDRYLSQEEEKNLRKAILEHFPDSIGEVDFALNTGLRLSEQYGLQSQNIDMQRRIITIKESKNGYIRRVPINDVAFAVLQDKLEKCNGSDLVFTYRQDAPIKRVRKWFHKALQIAKIENFTWHCMRHTFASRLVMAGVDIRTVQQLMGHRTIQMTCRYAHLAPEHQLDAVQRLCDIKSGSAQTEPTDTKTDTKHFSPLKQKQASITKYHGMSSLPSAGA